MSKKMIKWKRVGSMIIDLTIINMFISIITWFISPLGFITGTNIIIDFILVLLYIMMLIAIAYGYQYICIKRWGRSFGKIFLGVRYVNKKGRKPKEKDILKREFLKYYYLYSTLIIGYGVYVVYKVLFTNDKLYHEKKTGVYLSYEH